jgi:hypothetical protein
MGLGLLLSGAKVDNTQQQLQIYLAKLGGFMTSLRLSEAL